MVLQDKTRAITADDYWELANLPENQDKRLELVNGELVEIPMSDTLSSITAGYFISYLNQLLLDTRYGYVSAPHACYRLPNGNIRQPDAAFISKARFPLLGAKIFPVAPDIAVEVISASESAKAVRDKVREYLESGTAFVWCAYPETRSIDVCQLNPDGSITIHTLKAGEFLEGGEVLPGFKVAVEKFFPAEEA